MASTVSSVYGQTILEDCEPLPPPPPSWVRIGIFGSPCSGKHRLMAAFSTHPAADPAAASGEHHGELSSTEHACSATGTAASKSPRGARCSKRDEAHLLPFLEDACATLFECGAYDTPHLQTPTRVHFRIAATEPEGAAPADDAVGRRAETSVVDVELVNCWSFTCRSEVPKSEEHQRISVVPVHDEGVVLSCPELPVVVFRDEDIVSCDAFLFVIDVTSKASYDVCADLLSHLRSVAASSLSLSGDALGPRQPSGNFVPVASAFLSEPVIVVVASTHGIEEGRVRCVSSDECKTLGSVWRTPIFEVALLPTEVPKLRRVLEKIIMRVLIHQR